MGSVAIIILAAVIFFFAFFQVKTVEVMGSEHYSEDELKEAILKGPLTSNTIFAPRFYSKNAAEKFPYIENFSVKRSDRHKLIISVKEKSVVGCIPYLDSYIYFDNNGYFVEGSKIRDTKVAFFDGIQPSKIVMKEKLPIKGAVLNTAVALSTIFAKNDKVPDHISFDDNYEISLMYGDVTVQLGKDEYLEDKMTGDRQSAGIFFAEPFHSGVFQKSWCDTETVPGVRISFYANAWRCTENVISA